MNLIAWLTGTWKVGTWEAGAWEEAQSVTESLDVIGGGSYGKKRKDPFKHYQTKEEKEQERIELGIIEATKPIMSEKVKVAEKLKHTKPETDGYWELVSYQYLLNEELAKIQSDLLLNRIRESAINSARFNLILEAFKRRQSEYELNLALEYQRQVEEDIIFVLSVMAEI